MQHWKEEEEQEQGWEVWKRGLARQSVGLSSCMELRLTTHNLVVYSNKKTTGKLFR